MPLPIAHSLAGYALSEIQPLSFFDKKWKTILFFVLLANAADFDFLPGLLINDPSRFHHGISHTLGFSVLIGFLGALYFNFKKKLPFWKVFWIVGGVYFSHVLLDYFGEDNRVPYGVMALWPFTENFYISSFSLFKNVTRSDDMFTFFPSLFNAHNLNAVLQELWILGSLCVLMKIWIRRRKGCSHPNSLPRDCPHPNPLPQAGEGWGEGEGVRQGGDKKAFTFIELLGVMIILLLLGSMVLWTVRGASDKAKKAKCMSNLKALHQAVLMFAQDESRRLEEKKSGSPIKDFPTEDEFSKMPPEGNSAQFKKSILVYYASSSFEKLKCPLSPENLLGYKINTNLINGDRQTKKSGEAKCPFEEISNNNILIYEVNSTGIERAERHAGKCFGVTVFGEVDFDVSEDDLANKTI
jgi:inner membrane protein